VADEGGGPRILPPVKGHPALARHIATALTPTSSILRTFQAKPLDHGCFSPLSMLWPHAGDGPGAIVPLQVGVLRVPIPRHGAASGSAGLCAGRSRATRGFSRWPSSPPEASLTRWHGERAGFNNTPWDMEFLDLLERQPERLKRADDRTVTPSAAGWKARR